MQSAVCVTRERRSKRESEGERERVVVTRRWCALTCLTRAGGVQWMGSSRPPSAEESAAAAAAAAASSPATAGSGGRRPLVLNHLEVARRESIQLFETALFGLVDGGRR